MAPSIGLISLTVSMRMGLEPIQEELESDESVVIPCFGVIRDRSKRCGSLNTV